MVDDTTLRIITAADYYGYDLLISARSDEGD